MATVTETADETTSLTPAMAPERSLNQRMDALARANQIRTRRAQLKRDLKSGRLSIQSLLLNPPVLILDDATSAIDVHVESGIYEALRGLLTQRTTIVIAHRISTIALASRVLVLDEGRVIASGTHEELLATEPLYSEILAQTKSEGS